jgi:hypothetical protein
MKSQVLPQFWKLYYQLPKAIRRRAARAYRLWRTNPQAAGSQFKLVGKRQPVYSVRVNAAYRALGLLEGDTIYWFWIGAHDEYERIIQPM